MKIKEQMCLEIWDLNLRDVMGGVGDSMIKDIWNCHTIKVILKIYKNVFIKKITVKGNKALLVL